MRQLSVVCALALGATTVLSGDVNAQSVLKQLEDGAKKVAPVVAPGSTIAIQVIQGKDPVKAATDTAAAQARVIVSSGQALSAIDQATENKIKQAVGGDLAKVIEVVRLPQKIERAVAIQTIATVGDSLAKQKFDPKEFGAIPFAAVLQQAIDLYKSRGQDIPQSIKMMLATTFDKGTLDNARFVIDDNLGSLPGAINFLKEQSNDNHAVTVGNIIVFAKDPGLNNIRFWAHEMQHTVQYAKLGVSGFAAKYATDYAAMEKEADDVATKAEADAEVILRFVQTQVVAKN
jgi:hypothetical protein